MPLEQYKADDLLFNQNFLQTASTDGLSGYRGEWVLVQGEVADDKGQSAADKIVTLYEEIKRYKPKYPAAALGDVLASATEVRREGWGAV